MITFKYAWDEIDLQSREKNVQKNKQEGSTEEITEGGR